PLKHLLLPILSQGDLVSSSEFVSQQSISPARGRSSTVGGGGGHSSFRVGPAGGMGAIAGGISRGTACADRRPSKLESVSFQIDAHLEHPFDEEALIQSIRTTLEGEVSASGAVVAERRTFGPSKFGIDYEGEYFRGRICISGIREGAWPYSLHATL